MIVITIPQLGPCAAHTAVPGLVLLSYCDYDLLLLPNQDKRVFSLSSTPSRAWSTFSDLHRLAPHRILLSAASWPPFPATFLLPPLV